MRHSIDSSVDDHRRKTPSALSNMQLPQSALQFFTSRVGQLFKQGDSGQVRRSPRSESGVREALQRPSSVQITLMQRMGVTGRPFMDACKRRSLSS